MTGWWVALGVWYLGLVYVGMWNRRARPTWRRLDAYPLRLRLNLFTPFARRWRGGLAPADVAWAGAFRRAVLWRAAWAVVPPLVIFGWLYGTTWIRYGRALERRARLEEQIETLLRLQRERGFPESAPLGPVHTWPPAPAGPLREAAPGDGMGHPGLR